MAVEVGVRLEARDRTSGLPTYGSPVNGDLLDVNVWIALAQPMHRHHAQAKAYWEQTLTRFAQENADTEELHAIPSKLYFCRTTMLGLVRVLSQSSVAYGEHMSLSEAFSIYYRFKRLEEIGFTHENLVDVDSVLEELLTCNANLPMRMSTDIYLAALAKALNLRLVTMDRDFLRFNLPNCLVIETDASI
jgi:uncharacterized protein